MNRWGILAASAALLTLTAGCGESDVVEAPTLRPVRTILVYASGSERTRSFSGTAQAGMESRLSFKVAGTVQRVDVKVGDRVAAGTSIARIDPRDLRLRMEDASAAVARSEAEERRAAADYERVRQLYENDNASKTDLDAARAGAEATRAALRSARRNLDLANQQLEYADLKAPVSGAISSVAVEVNENVSAGQVIAVLSSGDRTEVAFAVPEMLISNVREGDTAQATFDALPGRTYPVRVTEVGVTATGAGAAFPIIARLEAATPEIRPGMAAQVSFRFGGSDNRERIRVPATAVLEDREGRFAFVVEAAAEPGLGVVRRRAVELGELAEDGIEILSGLADGDRVVTAGVTKIQDGLTVRVPELSE